MYLFSSRNDARFQKYRTSDFTRTPNISLDSSPDCLEKWNRLVKKSPKEFMALLENNLEQDVFADIKFFSEDNGSIHIEVMDGEDLLANCSLDFDFSRKRLSINLINVQDQGKNLGTALTENILELSDQIGLYSVSLETEDIGGYYWAKVGFLPTNSAWEELKEQIQNDLSTLHDTLSEKSRFQLTNILSENDPQAIWELADLSEEVGDSKLGQQLLIGKKWDGRLYLGDEIQEERYKSYFTEKKQATTPKLRQSYANGQKIKPSIC